MTVAVASCPEHVRVDGVANGKQGEDKVPQERDGNTHGDDHPLAQEQPLQPLEHAQHKLAQLQPQLRPQPSQQPQAQAQDLSPPVQNETSRPSQPAALGPPESIEPATVSQLYKGTCGEIDGKRHRVWVEWPALQLCWAQFDLPARPCDRVDLLQISRCQCEMFSKGENSDYFRAYVYAQSNGSTNSVTSSVSSSSMRLSGQQSAVPPTQAQNGDAATQKPVLCVVSPSPALRDFADALEQLVVCRGTEGPRGLEFIQQRLFQYLWLRQQNSLSDSEIHEAQAVLAFNLDPKEGVAYMQRKIGKKTQAEIGEWLAHMSTVKGGLDPTMLGGYFSRKDTLEVFRSFVSCLDFGGTDIVAALRRLFDTFKPGGEGQVITRILEYFSEAYFVQWQRHGDGLMPRTVYPNADSVLQVAVSLIMLNTGLHVATKKIGKRAPGAAMTVEEYIDNTRRVVNSDEVPDEILRQWYEAVKQDEISVEPLPRVPFSKLPVQPAIEGWLTAVLSPKDQRRLWAVLALQRLYLFSDASEVDPAEAIDLKDTIVRPVVEDDLVRERFAADLYVQKGGGGLFCGCFVAKASRPEPMDIESRAFEVQQMENKPAILKRLSQPRPRLALVAESQDLMARWVQLIQSGPYQ